MFFIRFWLSWPCSWKLSPILKIVVNTIYLHANKKTLKRFFFSFHSWKKFSVMCNREPVSLGTSFHVQFFHGFIHHSVFLLSSTSYMPKYLQFCTTRNVVYALCFKSTTLTNGTYCQLSTEPSCVGENVKFWNEFVSVAGYCKCSSVFSWTFPSWYFRWHFSQKRCCRFRKMHFILSVS